MSELENKNEEVLNDISNGEETDQKEMEIEPKEIELSLNGDEDKDITELPLPEEENEVIDQDKFNKTIKKIRMKERERAAAREAQLLSQIQNMQIQQLPYSQQMPNFPASNMDNMQPPERDAYDNEQQYMAAMVKHTIQQERMNEAILQRQAAIQQQNNEYFNTLNKVKDDGALKYEDFDETVSTLMTNFPADDIVKKAIIKSEFASDLLYFMGRNLEQSNKLVQMDPIDAVKKIHEMEMRFKEAKKKKTNPSSFQPPVNLKSQSARMGTPDAKEVDNMTPAQYAEWRRKVSSGSTENKWSR